MSEMVVFTQHENFDFLRFSSRVAKSSVDDFKAECVRVQATQAMTAQSFGVWALRLVDLRDTGVWEDVINPETGFAFFNDGFGAFCEYAFGLSKTMTSNLTKVAQFIQNHGDNVGALDERYRGYSFSQLVELSSVSPSNRQYFSSDMTVKEMRTAKNYMKMGGFFEDKNNADFDLLTYSTAFEEERKLGAGAKKTSPEVIPGQIDLEDISDSVKMDVIPTSELANAGEEEVDIYDMPMQTHSFDSDDYDEEDEAYEDMQAEMQTIEQDSEKSLPQAKSPIKEYDFSTRDNIRLFLNDYENWYYRDDIRTPFTKYCYWITLPNFDMVYALEMNVATGATLEGKQEHATEVEYFIFLHSQYYYKEMPNVFQITKRNLENYLMAHRDELNKRR